MLRTIPYVANCLRQFARKVINNNDELQNHAINIRYDLKDRSLVNYKFIDSNNNYIKYICKNLFKDIERADPNIVIDKVVISKSKVDDVEKIKNSYISHIRKKMTNIEVITWVLITTNIVHIVIHLT